VITAKNMATDLENGVENHKQKNFVSSPGSSSTSTEGPISDEGDAIRINENSTNDPVHFSPFRKNQKKLKHTLQNIPQTMICPMEGNW